ncbi:MAG: hypothetical protein ACREGA_00885 [Candidatus Saccharimonadales bacterium]
MNQEQFDDVLAAAEVTRQIADLNCDSREIPPELGASFFAGLAAADAARDELLPSLGEHQKDPVAKAELYRSLLATKPGDSPANICTRALEQIILAKPQKPPNPDQA